MVQKGELVPAEGKEGRCLACQEMLEVDDIETDVWGNPEADNCSKCGTRVVYQTLLQVTEVTYGAEEFNAAVYRGKKPVSELGYAERAVMMDKMIEQARIEQSLLELEAAIKMGLITEDEIMKQLSEKFGSE